MIPQKKQSNNFWETLPKPFFVLAPMADVTDVVFRDLVAKYSRMGEPLGGPDVLWTEFVSADGLCHPTGKEKLLVDLLFNKNYRPIVVQLFSSVPENMRNAARICAELGFDGIDINMGCPDRTIEKQGCGSAMIKTPEKAIEIIAAAKQGIIDSGRDIPLSVKTRVGYYTPDIDGWVRLVLMQNISCLTIHARTRKDLSKVPANWDYIRRVVLLRNQIAPNTKIIGNGDVADISDGIDKSKETNCDGIMIGRAVFGNPWIFDRARKTVKRGSWKTHTFMNFLPRAWVKKILGNNRYTVSDVSVSDRLTVLKEHAASFEKTFKHEKNFAIMKKHFKAYIHGFPGAKELREHLMQEGNTAHAVSEFIDTFLANHMSKK